MAALAHSVCLHTLYIFVVFLVVLGFLLNSVSQNKMQDTCCLIRTQNYFTFPATLPNDSYFIGSIFASASLKICAGLLLRLWLVINKNPPRPRLIGAVYADQWNHSLETGGVVLLGLKQVGSGLQRPKDNLLKKSKASL